MNRTVVMIMAGGRGSRLGPLTCHRSKPGVPFGGRFRIIDFVLSNVVNSGYRHIYVLTQYMASSLIKHLNRSWRLGGFGEFIEVVPMALGDALQLIWNGELRDAKSAMALIHAARREGVLPG